jgi:carbon storage regulator
MLLLRRSESSGCPKIKEDEVMLVLSRKCGEAIVIADGITVTVLEVQGSRVKLGIAAPGNTPIHRRELHERIMPCLPVGAYAEPALA